MELFSIIGGIFSVVGVIVVGAGLMVTWNRNGKSQSKRDGVLEERIFNLSKKLEDENTGLGAIKTAVENQRVNCAQITSSFKEKFKNLEGE